MAIDDMASNVFDVGRSDIVGAKYGRMSSGCVIIVRMKAWMVSIGKVWRVLVLAWMMEERIHAVAEGLKRSKAHFTFIEDSRGRTATHVFTWPIDKRREMKKSKRYLSYS